MGTGEIDNWMRERGMDPDRKRPPAHRGAKRTEAAKRRVDAETAQRRKDRVFSTDEACAISGATYRQLDYWARAEVLRPSVMEANGSGTARRYSFEDVQILAIARLMLDSGLMLEAVRKMVPAVRGIDAFDDLWLVIVAGEVHVVLDPISALAELAPGQVAHVLRPEPIRDLAHAR